MKKLETVLITYSEQLGDLHRGLVAHYLSCCSYNLGRLTGLEARSKVEEMSDAIGTLQSTDGWTPKIVNGVRFYVAVLK